MIIAITTSSILMKIEFCLQIKLKYDRNKNFVMFSVILCVVFFLRKNIFPFFAKKLFFRRAGAGGAHVLSTDEVLISILLLWKIRVICVFLYFCHKSSEFPCAKLIKGGRPKKLLIYNPTNPKESILRKKKPR